MTQVLLRSAESPDGQLVLELHGTDDFSIGFKDQAWHTHGDLLVPQYGATASEAAQALFDLVLCDGKPICVAKRIGRDVEIWVTDDPASEFKYLEDGEVLRLRLWSGKPYVF